MRLFEKRPLAIWCFTFVLLSFLFFFLGTTIKWLLLLAFLISVPCILFCFRGYRRTLLIGALLACLLAAICSLFTYDLGYFATHERYVGKTVLVCGEVEEIAWESNERERCTIKLSAIADQPTSIHIQLSTRKGLFQTYDHFTATVSLKSAIAENGTFSDRWYLLSRDILFVGTTERVHEITHVEDGIVQRFDTLRDELSRVSEAQIGGDAADLVRGLLLGERDFLSQTIARDFRRCGASHLLAVSGLHLSILLGLLTYLGVSVLPSRLSRFPMLVTFLLFFVLLIGFRASILRASGMAILSACAALLGRRSDPMTNLSVSAAGILLCSPTAILDLGYLLSCLATFGILAIGLPLIAHVQVLLKRALPKHGLLRRVLLFLPCSLIVTVSATVFTLPVCVICFDSFALMTLPANLVLIPLATLLLSLAIPALLCGFLSQNITFLADVTRMVADVILQLVSQASRHVGITLPYTIPTLSLILCLGVFVLFFILLVTKRTRFVCIALCLLLMISAIPVTVVRVSACNETSVRFLPSAETDLLLIANGTEVTLVVGGTCTEEALDLAFTLSREECYVDELAMLVICGPTSDALSLLGRYLKRVYVQDLVLLFPSNDSDISKLKKKLGATGTCVRSVTADTESPLQMQNSTLYYSAREELVINAYGHSLYYHCNNKLELSEFYYRHLENLSAILLSGRIFGIDGRKYIPPIVAFRSSFTTPKETDVFASSQYGIRIRLTEKGCCFSA